MKPLPLLAALVLTFVPAAALLADSLYLENFSGYSPDSPWTTPVDPWTHTIGSSWRIVEGKAGAHLLQSSSETKPPLGAAGQVHFAFKIFDRPPTRIVLKMEISEGATIPAGQNATLIIGFTTSLDPQNEVAVVFDPKTDSVGGLELGVVPVRIVARTTEPGQSAPSEPEPSQLAAEMLDVTVPFTLEIEVAPTGSSVRARINDESWSEAVPLREPWDNIRFLRLYQRSLQVSIHQIEFLDGQSLPQSKTTR